MDRKSDCLLLFATGDEHNERCDRQVGAFITKAKQNHAVLGTFAKLLATLYDVGGAHFALFTVIYQICVAVIIDSWLFMNRCFRRLPLLSFQLGFSLRVRQQRGHKCLIRKPWRKLLFVFPTINNNHCLTDNNDVKNASSRLPCLSYFFFG